MAAGRAAVVPADRLHPPRLGHAAAEQDLQKLPSDEIPVAVGGAVVAFDAVVKADVLARRVRGPLQGGQKGDDLGLILLVVVGGQDVQHGAPALLQGLLQKGVQHGRAPVGVLLAHHVLQDGPLAHGIQIGADAELGHHGQHVGQTQPKAEIERRAAPLAGAQGDGVPIVAPQLRLDRPDQIGHRLGHPEIQLVTQIVHTALSIGVLDIELMGRYVLQDVEKVV